MAETKKTCRWWTDRGYILFDCGAETGPADSAIEMVTEWKFCPNCGRRIRRESSHV